MLLGGDPGTGAVPAMPTVVGLGSVAAAVLGALAVANLGPVAVAAPSASALPEVASSNEADKNAENRCCWLVLGICVS